MEGEGSVSGVNRARKRFEMMTRGAIDDGSLDWYCKWKALLTDSYVHQAFPVIASLQSKSLPTSSDIIFFFFHKTAILTRKR